MSDPLRTVWEALERADCQPGGPPYQFHARCPAHDGTDADSLSIGTGADGRALIWCHVGCDTHEVVRRIGLLWSDLFPEGHASARRRNALSGRRAQRPIDLVLGSLQLLGIPYRATRSPQLWVAGGCPVCHKSDGWPLWIPVDERGRVNLSCFNGCAEHEVLAALASVKSELAA